MSPNYGLTQFDQKLITKISFVLNNNQGKIDFQFVPRITSESNNSLWHEENMAAIEPLKTVMSAGGRKINMEWEYLATDGVWDCARVGNTLRKLKSYFFEFKQKPYPVAIIKYTHVIPENINFRIADVNISYSNEIVENNGFHPLHTKVVVSLEMATTINYPGTGKPGKLKIEPLKPAVFNWY